ncbi:YlmH family RNA-binding protein [Jeotgalicoccus meleagridis]|uniref:RNA-binding S4 domain-containing protein n=1 Tax=Jeotgalicoccus meleagridis TaxID=2759181 RepID=A0A6V7RNK2_9STAP|nr:YlmH/Sll1252 family protein [Jeotgalicoccus meleagridis]CAD2079287.1 hypothetical protein JEODO184_01647 [Jeotgalicoccus meleagridis]
MKEIFQHFRKEEHNVLTLLNGKFEQASNQYYAVLTDFLNPRERTMVDSLSGYYDDISVHYYGGGENSERERMRALLVPEYIDVNLNDFEITVFEMSYPEKFVSLSHRNILGAIMSLGLDRSVIGDIVIADSIQFAVSSTIKDVFIRSLNKIKNAPINLKEIPHEEFIESKIPTKTVNILSSSYRIDAVVANVLKEGRAKSKERIEKGKVKVNHSIVDEPSFIIESGDVVSVRSFGRFFVAEQIAETKKGKYRLEIKIVTDD